MDKETYKHLSAEIKESLWGKKRSKYINKRGGNRKKHTKKVIELASTLCIMQNINETGQYLVELGALLHDVGKCLKSEYKNSYNEECKKKFGNGKKIKHNHKGAFIAEKILDDLNLDIESNDKKLIVNMVLYHCGEYDDEFSNLQKDEKRLIAIVRMADKISKVYK